MPKKNIYTKDNPTVLKMQKRAHHGFSEQITNAMNKQKLNPNSLTPMIGAQAPMTYHALKPDENITLNTMCRIAAALGGELRIEVEFSDDESSE